MVTSYKLQVAQYVLHITTSGMDGTPLSVVHEDSPLLTDSEDYHLGSIDQEKQEFEDDEDENDHASLLGIPAMVEAVHDAVETGVEEMMEEAHDLADVIIEEFQDANENDFHYLEMGLTRNLSILPADIVDVMAGDGPLSVLGDDMSVMTLDTVKMEVVSTPISAYFLLLSAVVSLSSIGPLLVLQDNATPTMKIVWRMTGTSLLLIPFACYDLYTKGFPHLTYPQWCTFLISTMCYDVMTLAFVISLDYTAVGNAVILSNSLALILLVGKLFVGDPIMLLEGIGALVAFGGAVLCSKDSANSREASNALLGDVLAMISAIGGVGYLVFAKTARAHMPMYVFMFSTMALGAFLAWIFQFIVLGEHTTFDMNYNHGIWGFLLPDADRLPLELITVVVCNLCGTMG